MDGWRKRQYGRRGRRGQSTNLIVLPVPTGSPTRLSCALEKRCVTREHTRWMGAFTGVSYRYLEYMVGESERFHVT